MGKKKLNKGKKVLKKNPRLTSKGTEFFRSNPIRVENSTISDWGGTLLDPEIRNHFEAGNVVRVAFGEFGEGRVLQTVYFKITEIIGRDRHGLRLRGVCEDPYYGQEDWFCANDGHIRVFSAKSVTEVPLEWPQNKNLEKIAQFRQRT